MLKTIRQRYGEAERIWVMDRGIPTEEVITEVRATDSQVKYLVGTPKGRLTCYEAAIAEKPWQSVRPQLRVKLLPQDGEPYVLAESQARAGKERGMRRRKLKAYWKRLGEQMLEVCIPTTDGRELLLIRYTEPSENTQLLLERLGLNLPPQPPPKSDVRRAKRSCSPDLWAN